MITNIEDNNKLKEELKKHKKIMGYINFSKTGNHKIPKFNEKDLNINKQTKYLQMIKTVWNVNEEFLLIQLKNANLQPPDNPYLYVNNTYIKNTINTLDLFEMPKDLENMNKINKSRYHLFSKECKNLITDIFEINDKLQEIGMIDVKKYILFFYNDRRGLLENAETLYRYNYFLDRIKEYDKNSLKQIYKNAEKSLYYKNPEIDKMLNQFQKQLDLLNKIFNDDNSQFKEVTDEIKNYFNPNNNIITHIRPQNIFLNDLTHLGLNFDFLTMIKYYEKLSKQTKIRYEIKFLKYHLLVDYKKYMKKELKIDKEKKLRKKNLSQKENKNKSVYKKNKKKTNKNLEEIYDTISDVSDMEECKNEKNTGKNKKGKKQKSKSKEKSDSSDKKRKKKAKSCDKITGKKKK